MAIISPLCGAQPNGAAIDYVQQRRAQAVTCLFLGVIFLSVAAGGMFLTWRMPKLLPISATVAGLGGVLCSVPLCLGRTPYHKHSFTDELTSDLHRYENTDEFLQFITKYPPHYLKTLYTFGHHPPSLQEQMMLMQAVLREQALSGVEHYRTTWNTYVDNNFQSI